MRIPASGGEPVPVTKINPPQQTSHLFPQFFPDGKHFLFHARGNAEQSGIYLASLDGGTPKRLIPADSTGMLVKPDWIAFVRQGTLIARRFNLTSSEWTGEAVTVANMVGLGARFEVGFSVGEGHVAYRPGGASDQQLAWFDRTGKMFNAATIDMVGFPDLSPDDRRVLLFRAAAGNPDIWMMDLIRGGLTRLTTEVTNDSQPIWSPDGTQILFTSDRKGVFDLFVKSASGTGASNLLLETPYAKVPQDWSNDGRFVAYYENNPKTGRDLWVLDMTVTPAKTRPIANTPFEESMAEFSPDGRWLAYQTDESGRAEIVVQPFPELNRKWQVSTAGGFAPRWRHDGGELYFVALDGKLMAVPIKSSGSIFDAGTPIALFPTRIATSGLNQYSRPQYAVSRDGRFLICQPSEQATASPITLILNWNPGRPQ